MVNFISEGKSGGVTRRCNISLTNFESLNLNRLAVSCNTKPTTMAQLLVLRGISNPNTIKYLHSVKNLYGGIKFKYKDRGGGGKRVVRINMAFKEEDYNKLKQFTLKFNSRPTTIACVLVIQSLFDSEVVHQLQEEMNVNEKYRVTIISNGYTQTLE